MPGEGGSSFNDLTILMDTLEQIDRALLWTIYQIKAKSRYMKGASEVELGRSARIDAKTAWRASESGC